MNTIEHNKETIIGLLNGLESLARTTFPDVDDLRLDVAFAGVGSPVVVRIHHAGVSVNANGQWTAIIELSQVWEPYPKGSMPYLHTWRAAVDVWADYRAHVEDARTLGFLR